MKQKLSILMGIQFFIYFGFSMVIPVIPEIVKFLELPTMHMGWLLAVYSIASFISAPFWGYLADRFGRRPILLIGLIGFGSSFFTFGYFLDQLWILYVSRIVTGISSGALYTSTMSMVADLSSKEERTKYMGLMGMMTGMGFIFGPGVGGLLSTISYSFSYYMTALIILLVLIYSVLKLKETYHGDESYKKKITIPINYLKEPVGLLLITTFIVTFTLSGMESTFQLLAIELINIKAWQMGILFFIGGICSALLQGGYLRRVKIEQETKIMVIGQVLTAVGFFMLPFTMNLVYAGVCIVLLMCGNALVRTLLTSQVTKQAAHNEMGKMTSAAYSMDSLARVFGPLMFNYLFTILIGLPFYFGVVMTFIGMAFILIYLKKVVTERD